MSIFEDIFMSIGLFEMIIIGGVFVGLLLVLIIMKKKT